MTKVVRGASLIFAGLTAGAGAAPDRRPPVIGTQSEIDRLAEYARPAGWLSSKEDTPEPEVRMVKLDHVIRVRLFGGKDSRYPSIQAFMEGFEARAMGRLPDKAAEFKIAGAKTIVYRARLPIARGDPHAVANAPPPTFSQEFCVVPVGERFLVLSYADESGIPDPERVDRKVWRPFLKNFKLKNFKLKNFKPKRL